MPLVSQQRSPSVVGPKNVQDSSLALNGLAQRVATLERKVKSPAGTLVVPPYTPLTQAAQAGLTIKEVVQGGSGGGGSGGGSGGAPVESTFVTEANESSNLPDSRQLAVTAPIVLTDNGAGATLVVSLNAKSQRVATGALTAATTTPITLTWTAPFPDANYTPVASVVDSSGFLAVVQIVSFGATTVVVNVINNDPTNPHTGTLCVIAVHD